MNLRSIKQIKSAIGAKKVKSIYYTTDFSYAVTLNVFSKEIIGRNIFTILNEEEEKDLNKNSKKILSSEINSKLFKKDFKEDKLMNIDCFKIKLEKLRNCDKKEFMKICDDIANDILENKSFKDNISIIFTRAALNSQTDIKRVILCTINKVNNSSLELIVEDDKMQYVQNLVPRINTSNPTEGFLYPDVEIEDNSLLENNDGIIYYTSKANNINTSFVSNILECEIKMTENQQKEKFNQVITEIVKGKVTPNTLYKIYENISNRFENEENEEDRIINPLTMCKILKDVDLEIEKSELEEIYNKIFGFTNFSFKVDSIVPDNNKKSIKIVTFSNDAEIKIKPQFLKNIKKIVDENGQTAILIPLNGEELLTNGFVTKLEN